MYGLDVSFHDDVIVFKLHQELPKAIKFVSEASLNVDIAFALTY